MAGFRLFIIVSVTVVIAGAVFGRFVSSHEAGPDGDAVAGALVSEGRAFPESSRVKTPSEKNASWGASPFSTDIPPAIDSRKRIALRRVKMEAFRYQTPPAYDVMDLKTLTNLARQGDVNAMVQLGEQYGSEQDELQQDPYYDIKVDPNATSRRYFQGAIREGYTHLAAVMSRKSFDKDDLVDAYAWNILAERMNDKSNGNFYRERQSFDRMTQAQKDAAAQQLALITEQLGPYFYSHQ